MGDVLIVNTLSRERESCRNRVPSIADFASHRVKRVGLKYCGGCNPSYERVEYVRKIQEAAGNRIEWVSLDEGGFATLLLVSGCDKQCVEMAEYEESGCRIIRIKDTCITPSEILSHLLEGDS